MKWDTLLSVQRQTKCEFIASLAKRHHFVRCFDGKWTRTLGPPSAPDGLHVHHVRGRIWHLVKFEVVDVQHPA